MSKKRIFSSYGTVIPSNHYFAPRLDLIEKGKKILIGDDKGGHYITVWASRQSGKSTTLMEIRGAIKKERDDFLIINLSAEDWGSAKDGITGLQYIVEEIEIYLETQYKINIKTPEIKTDKDFVQFFTKKYFSKKIIMVIDEFDRLEDDVIAEITHAFRKIYLKTIETQEVEKPVLHSLALIGIRSVLGIENQKGSPFNVQNSLQIPHLTYDEVNQMFKEYTEEHGQDIDQDVIDILFYETQGQPGLVSWFGELLTVECNRDTNKPITMDDWNYSYAEVNAIPSSHLLNLISKVNENEDAKKLVIDLFQTREKIEFIFTNKLHNYLYLNGIIKPVKEKFKNKFANYIKFTCQFVHRQLFQYYAAEFRYSHSRLLVDPFMDLEAIINDTYIDIDGIINLYQQYVNKNREKLFKDASRRKTDLQICEAVFHFDIYSYLSRFLQSKPASVQPEFPTGNGKIDLIIKHNGRIHGIELKSFVDATEMNKAKIQTAEYANSLNIKEIFLLFFIEFKIPADKREELESSYFDDNGIEVKPRFLEV